MRTHLAPATVLARRRPMTRSIWSIALVLPIAACWYPKERGQRLEQRLERIEGDGSTRQPDQTQAATQEQAGRVDARLAEVQRKLDALQATTQETRTDRSARQDKLDRLADEVSRLRAGFDGYGRRLDSVEKSVAALHSSANRASASRPPAERKAAAPAEELMKPEAPQASTSKPGFLALAREQESKGQKAVARDLYQEYVEKFPTDPSAAQAHFRLGELAFGERRYQDAIAQFGKVAKDFPRSAEAPDALLRTAASMTQLDLHDEAVAVLSEIPKRYPASPAAARAKQRLAELAGSARKKQR